MYLFHEGLTDVLSTYAGAHVEQVGLGLYDFLLVFDNNRKIQSLYKASLLIQGYRYVWEENPINAPLWVLAGQAIHRIELNNSEHFTLSFQGGDEVCIYTQESPYECGLLEFMGADNKVSFEIF